jgi:hypothetical protein
MMNMKQLYALADNLQMGLHRNPKSITGEREVKLNFGDFRLYAQLKIVSSYVHDDGAAVLVQAFGDVGLMVAVEGAEMQLTCAVVDMSMLGPKRGIDLLTRGKPSSSEAADTLVSVGVKARFTRSNAKPWQLSTV